MESTKVDDCGDTESSSSRKELETISEASKGLLSKEANMSVSIKVPSTQSAKGGESNGRIGGKIESEGAIVMNSKRIGETATKKTNKVLES